jgi:hypothetical protein
MSDPEPLLEVQIHDDAPGELIVPINQPNMYKWCLIYSGIMALLLGVGIILWYYGSGNL